MSGLNTKQLTSHFNSLAHDVHCRAALLNERLSKIEPAPGVLAQEPIVRKVIALIALTHRLINSATDMVNEGVDGGIKKT